MPGDDSSGPGVEEDADLWVRCSIGLG